MRYMATALLAGFLVLFFSDFAEARRGGGSKSQAMHFVADTDIEIDGINYSLCHLTTTQSVLFVNLFRSLEGYALAANRCDIDEYISFSPEQVARAKSDGVIDSSVPNDPKLSMASKVEGHWGWALVLLVLGFLGLKLLTARKRRGERQAMMGDASPTATAILDAMCHAAKADGSIDASEIAQIQNIAAKMTGQNFDTDTVKSMANMAEADPSERDFKRFASGRTTEEHELMMRGVLMVVAADGILDGKEKVFVSKLAQAIKFSGERINQMLNDVISGNAR